MNCFSFYLKVLILHCAGVWRICACTCADSRGLSGVCYLYLTVLDRVFHRDWVANKLLGDLPGSTMPGHVQAGDSSSGHHAYLASILTPWAISLNPFLHFFFFFGRTVFLNAVCSADSFFFHWFAQFCQESHCYPAFLTEELLAIDSY